MKKSIYFLFVAIISSFIFISCSSVPKTVNSGDALAIGKVTFSLKNFRPFEDVEFKGKKTDGIELTFKELDTNKIYNVKADREGFFIIKNFKPEKKYVAESVKIKVLGNSGAQTSLGINFVVPKPFEVYDNMVINLGDLTVDCDGLTHYCYFKLNTYIFARQYFKDLCEEEESEWFDKEIKNSPICITN